MNKKKFLSKSALLTGMACKKALYFRLFHSDFAREVTPAEQLRFDYGNEVGVKAQEHFPGGVLIDVPYYDRDRALLMTEEAINKGEKTIYEAALAYENFWCKVDILNRNKGVWDLIEVKSTTSVKEQHLLDVAIQAFILMNQGLPMGRYYLMHVNNKCEYPDLKNLFTLVDITDDVEELVAEIEATLKDIGKVTEMKEVPEVEIGPHCDSPYECPFKSQCWGNVPDYNVFHLPGVGPVSGWKMIEEGTWKITDLDENDYNGNKARAISVTKSQTPYINKSGIKNELDKWQWPLYFFDFETLGEPIPRFYGEKPFGAIPFQFSCHVWESPEDERLHHFEYLHTEKTDPRPQLVEAIVKNFGDVGSVVAYNKSFERGVLNKLAERFPKLKKKLHDISDRLVDPQPIIRSHVYYPDFRGSFSIKDVAPALVGEKLSYKDLDVSGGTEAQAVIHKIYHGDIKDPEEIKRMSYALLEYCRQDTLAMVELVRWLMKNAE